MTTTARHTRRAPLPIVRSIAELRAAVARWRRSGDSIGIVPTMGALHDGHLELVRRARRDCMRVIATIFVNPTQFNRPDDLASYPREEAQDAGKLQQIGADLLFAPPVEEIYPAGFRTKVLVSELTDCLCGVTRPGHLDGVSTVVSKLLIQALPDRAYFGEKDYQQLLVVSRMARDLDIPVEIVGVETVREADGLALSSRNQLLTPENRARAAALNRVLRELAARMKDGAAPAGPALAWGREALARAGIEKIDYLDLRTADTLRELERADRPARLFVAAWLGDVRLIDNIPVGPG